MWARAGARHLLRRSARPASLTAVASGSIRCCRSSRPGHRPPGADASSEPPAGPTASVEVGQPASDVDQCSIHAITRAHAGHAHDTHSLSRYPTGIQPDQLQRARVRPGSESASGTPPTQTSCSAASVNHPSPIPHPPTAVTRSPPDATSASACDMGAARRDSSRPGALGASGEACASGTTASRQEDEGCSKANGSPGGSGGGSRQRDAQAADSLRTRLRRLLTSWQQGVVASIGAAMGIAALGFFLYAPVHTNTVHQTVVVASEAMTDAKIKEHAIQLSKDVVARVLTDEASVQFVSDLVVQLLRRDDTKIAVSSFIRAIFEDHYTQEVSKKFVLTTVLDPWIQEQLQIIAKNLAIDLLLNPDVKAALTAYLVSSASEALRDVSLQEEAARSARACVAKAITPWR